jgi:hypothetical protein
VTAAGLDAEQIAAALRCARRRDIAGKTAKICDPCPLRAKLANPGLAATGGGLGLAGWFSDRDRLDHVLHRAVQDVQQRHQPPSGRPSAHPHHQRRRPTPTYSS